MVPNLLKAPMHRQIFPWLKRVCLITGCTVLPFFPTQAQRLVVPSGPQATESPPALATTETNLPSEMTDTSAQILKVYPDGTKKIVPLESLKQVDNGEVYGGPPHLSVYTGPSPASILSPQSPERLSVASIGTSEATTSLNASLPASPDPMATPTMMVAADPMGGGGSPAPIDPLSGTAPKTVPPLQTVSGKPAPIVGDTSSVQLGEWESFFLNAGIGGSYQGQLTARRIWNGNNRQAYPYGGVGTTPPPGAPYNQVQVGGENFTFNPGFRLDVEFGYNFYEWLGVGLQTGLIYNGINQYNIDIDQQYQVGSQIFQPGSYHFSADGELVQVPVQLNAILRWPGQMKLRPFIGGGIGAVWQQLDVNNYYAGPFDIQGNYCRSAFQFGWNAQAGLTYTVEPGLDFYGAFKMLSAFMPVIGNYQFENTYNFAVEIGIQSRF